MGAWETTKELLRLAQQLDNIEILKQVLELQGQVLELQAENHGLRTKVSSIEQAATFAGTMKFKKPFYYVENDTVPYCPRCWEVERKAVHLDEDWNGRRWECKSCTNVYLLDGTAPPSAMIDIL